MSREDVKSTLKILNDKKATGSQGTAGFAVDRKTKQELFYKSPKHMDYQLRHESFILRQITDSIGYCPHFCKFYGSLQVPFTDKKSPKSLLDKGEKYFERDVIFMESLGGTRSFTSWIHTMNANQLNSVQCQTLLALLIANRQIGLTHNDLHTDNINIEETGKDVVMLYRFSSEERNYSIMVPTLGKIPKIFDFGYGYCTKLRGTPMYCSLNHTDSGYIPIINNPINDYKMFLIGLANDTAESHPRLSAFAKSVFKNYSVNWERGWDSRSEYSATTFVGFALQELFHKFWSGKYDLLKDKIDEATEENDEEWLEALFEERRFLKTYKSASIFGDSRNTVVCILHSLISHPIKKYTDVNFNDMAERLIHEFNKIEMVVHNSQHRLYLLYLLVDIARKYKRQYNKNPTPELILTIRREFFEQADEHFNAFNPLVDFTNLIMSIYELSKAISNVYYHLIGKLYETIRKENETIDALSDPSKFVLNFIKNFPVKYKYSTNTEIIICDSIRGRNRRVRIKDMKRGVLKQLNDAPFLKKGDIIMDLIGA